MLTKRQLEALRKMRDDDEEIAYERGRCYIGDERFGARTFWALLRHCAISQTDCSGGAVEYYRINETGNGYLDGKDMPPELKAAAKQHIESTFDRPKADKQ